jgi:hypothetical protein
MDTDLLKYLLDVTVLLKKTARVHDTITSESDGLVPLRPWSWTCLPVYSNAKELQRVAESCYSYRIHEAKKEYSHQGRYPVELMMKRERSRSKGVAGKVDVLDELHKMSCKRLMAVRR